MLTHKLEMRKKQRKNGDYHEKECSGKHAKRLRGILKILMDLSALESLAKKK